MRQARGIWVEQTNRIWLYLLSTLLLSSMLLCSGCSTTELEDRGFPLAIGVDKNQDEIVLSFDFPDLSGTAGEKNPSSVQVSFSVEAGAYYEAEKAYENNTNKVLDYNHLKALVIGEEFLKDDQALRELLSWLEKEEVIARNTCLFAAGERASEILTLTGNTDGSVGKYLEQMVESQEDFKEDKIVTIGELMNQWHNQNEVLLIPVLTDNGGIPSITKYAVLDGFSYKENISVEEAMKAFLCQGKMRHFLYRLEDGEVLNIQDLKTRVDIEKDGDCAVVTVYLSGNASVKREGKKGTGTSGQLKKRLNRQLQESLHETAADLLKEPGMDISNSFYMLGGYDRELYRQYQQDYDGYREHLKLDFVSDMEIVNE